MRTMGEVLDRNKGIGPGFDFLRIALAMSVLFAHSFLIAEGEKFQYSTPPLALMHASIIPMFFTLSGFLITGSALRLRLKDFILNRGMRIVPALVMDIFFAAIVIGPIFTTLSLREYFSTYEFLSYFANIVGLIHYVLPGVFESNPFPNTVNGSLWTVPFEIGCYAIMALIILTHLLKRPRILLCAALVFAVLVFISLAYEWVPFGGEGRIFTATNHFLKSDGRTLYVYFLAGILLYLFRNKIPFHPAIFGTAILLFFLAAFDVFAALPQMPVKLLLIPIVAYVTVYVGLSPIPRIPIYGRGDYSYGIYLYGYPFQQALVTLFPKLTSPWLHFGISMVLVTGVAMLSWHFIEKPTLGLRRKYSFTARKGDAKEELPTAAAPSSCLVPAFAGSDRE
ncbi:acyltransferase [Mesorhizobium loti]|uniref:Probable sugar acetylase n=2 Tax=Phyllobacteriaceae TaxID=69277 RepID=M5AM14_RHILI|nr:sugar acetylase [Mesorhizobium loti NZP2037]OBP79520.1 sugar acetylase [Mesorhizobium loti]QKC66366.1 acyltransferase [Mesorhizobium jarvisii]OBP93778.1 sugar acetylase [Mesorhizobium loti]OBQ73205.1 sugar acetylase [Mesorhizobium loti]